MSMNLVNREQLKQKLDREENKFKLVNALAEWAFNGKYIYSSLLYQHY
jgi:hypothetical protein